MLIGKPVSCSFSLYKLIRDSILTSIDNDNKVSIYIFKPVSNLVWISVSSLIFNSMYRFLIGFYGNRWFIK